MFGYREGSQYFKYMVDNGKEGVMSYRVSIVYF